MTCPDCAAKMWTCNEVEDSKPCGKHWHYPDCGCTFEKDYVVTKIFSTQRKGHRVDCSDDYVSIHDADGEIVYWDRAEWIEDPSLVVTIAHACHLAVQGANLRVMLNKEVQCPSPK